MKEEITINQKQIQGLMMAMMGASDVNLNDGYGKPLVSAHGALNVHAADVHEIPVNDFFHLHDGVTTTLTTAIAVGDTSLTVGSATGFVVGNHLHILNGSSEHPFPIIISTVGSVITVGRPFSHAYPTAGTSIEQVIEDLSTTAGSLAAPISYKVMPQAGEKFHILRLIGSAVGGTANDDGKFAGLTRLTNGCVIRKYDGTTGTFTKFSAWHDNADIISDMYDVIYSGAPQSTFYGMRFRWTLSRLGMAIKLDGDAGDYLEILIQDDITALENFNLNAQGHSDV